MLSDKTGSALGLLDGILTAPCSPESVAVAWTGGKDSTVALDLWRTVLKQRGRAGSVRVLSIDTGYKFPQIIKFRDMLAVQWGIQLHVVRPIISLVGYPVAQDSMQCCTDLKVRPLQAALKDLGITTLITGIRKDEHPLRAETRQVEEVAEPEHKRIHPVLEFTEMDIWAYTFAQQIPYCSLYDEGYRSLGCRPCTRIPEHGAEGAERAGRDARKEKNMQSLRSLGYF